MPRGQALSEARLAQDHAEIAEQVPRPQQQMTVESADVRSKRHLARSSTASFRIRSVIAPFRSLSSRLSQAAVRWP